MRFWRDRGPPIMLAPLPDACGVDGFKFVSEQFGGASAEALK